jgi:hypothetical protein
MSEISLASLRLCGITLLIVLQPLVSYSHETSGAIQENKVYRANIKTVLLHKAGNQLSAPVIQLKSNDKLQLSFDDLDNDRKNFKFTIIHCESDWTVSSQLIQNDFIAGFSEDLIDDFSYSFNTTIPYTHYSLEFPTGDLSPKISGNYILCVYDDEPSDTVLTRRFMVAEDSQAEIIGNIRQAASPTDRFTRQEVDFEVRFNGMTVANPGREIRIVVTQNDRWDNAIRDIPPRSVRDGSLDYNYDEKIVFNGGNEYRSFDTKSLIYQSERIRKIIFDTGVFQVFLLDDIKRTTKNHISDEDINGRLFVKNEEHADNSDIEADYAWVYFFLPFEPYLSSGQVYLLGALTGWQLNNESRMDYNPFRKGYIKRLFLKQGYYNYLYVFRDKGKNRADEALIEGSHWETENEYTVWVYYHETGGLYDRLIAYRNLVSNK